MSRWSVTSQVKLTYPVLSGVLMRSLARWETVSPMSPVPAPVPGVASALVICDRLPKLDAVAIAVLDPGEAPEVGVVALRFDPDAGDLQLG
jgi:hypothetical protein